jgi:hypothetical protein
MNDMTVNHLTGDMGVTEKIKKAMYDVARQFVYIGFLLWEVKEYEYHTELGYDSVYSYAESELGFKRTSVKNFIAICETFCNKGRDTLTGKSYFSEHNMSIDPNYEKFNYSQLTEMLSMSVPQRQLVTPDMSVKEIRSIKQQRDPDQIIDNNLDRIGQQLRGQTSDQEIDFKTLDKAIAITKGGQTSDHFIIESSPSDLIAMTGPGHQEAIEVRTDMHSVLINNHWGDISEELLLKLIKAAGLKKTKNLCFDIEIKVHKDN